MQRQLAAGREVVEDRFGVRTRRGAGIEPIERPIRGGTDGSRLTEKGVPTPNLFTGMQNFHGPLEWISVQDMTLSTRLCVELARLWADCLVFDSLNFSVLGANLKFLNLGLNHQSNGQSSSLSRSSWTSAARASASLARSSSVSAAS